MSSEASINLAIDLFRARLEVGELRREVAALKATAPSLREMTEAEAADVLREMVTAARHGNPLAPVLRSAFAECAA